MGESFFFRLLFSGLFGESKRSVIFCSWVLLVLFDVTNDFLFLLLFVCFLFWKDEILAARFSENLIRTSVKRTNR